MEAPQLKAKRRPISPLSPVPTPTPLRSTSPAKTARTEGTSALNGHAKGVNGSSAGTSMPKLKFVGNVYQPQCPAQKALETVASKWAILIMHRLLAGPVRFNQLQRDLEGISQKVLTQQLRKLEKTGLVDRHVHATVPPSVEYSLTSPGRELKDALSGLCQWANKHAALLGLQPDPAHKA